jgi:sugar phosphate permease
LYLEKHKITSIHNKISIIVDKKPSEVGVDPYNKLIDTNSDDNRKKLAEEALIVNSSKEMIVQVILILIWLLAILNIFPIL